MENNRFVAVDFVVEQRHRSAEIVKIDAVKFDVDKVDFNNIDATDINERYTALIKPRKSDRCADGSSFYTLGDAVERLYSFVEDCEIVVFDAYAFNTVRKVLDKNGIDFELVTTNVVIFAQELAGDLRRDVSLNRLAEYYGVSKDDDVEMIAKVFLNLIKQNNFSEQSQNEGIYYTPLYRQVLRDKEWCGSQQGIKAEMEIKVLQRARLSEAFSMLVDMLGELRDNGIMYRANGAINISKLAYCAGIVDIEMGFYDYYFSRFVNPYRNESIKAPHLSISIDVESLKVESAVELMRELSYHYATDRTLFVVQTADTGFPDEYAFAERYNKSVLDITVNPSTELERFTALREIAAQTREVKDKEVFDYIQKTPISVFDNADKYFKILSAINARNINDVTLAIAMCESGREDALDDIIKFRQDGRSLRSDDIATVLHQSCGVFMYQEQGMRILCELSGCSQFYADNIRRAMAKHDIKALEQFKQAFLFGGEDVDGVRFGGCVEKDRMVSGRNYWAEICDVMPKLYLKAHARARAKFFIDCAKLQMQS